MNDAPDPPTRAAADEPSATPPDARVQTRRQFHFIWMIPIVAVVVAGFLAWRAISERGPTIQINFSSADGLTAGQTKIRHKAVELGTVHTITLAEDMSHVQVRADMHSEAARYLTSNARFWVVRPRLAGGNISGLDTLVSGAYIEMDPGGTRGASQLNFTGLEEPPAVRSDEPGRSFVLNAERIGALASGSPVFYHGIVVGEVLGYDPHLSDTSQISKIPVHVFIREPYDRFVHAGTHFWNASGFSLQLGAQGVQFRLESLQAALSGGIAFDTPAAARTSPSSAAEATFTLYHDEVAAAGSDYRERIPCLVYFQGSVRGLAVGAPVELFGIQIGDVTAISLEVDPNGENSRVAVHLEIQPERMVSAGETRDATAPIDAAQALVKRGLRVQLRSANYLTGQLVVAFDFFKDVPPAVATETKDGIVLPTTPGGLDGITTNVGDILRKIDALPLGEIASNLNETLAGVRGATNGPELKQGLRSLNETLAALQGLVTRADTNLEPALKRLPEIMQGLQTAVDRAGRLVGSADAGYGENSQFRRDVERLLSQVSDTARSVRLLADYLDQHPEALLRGRSGGSGER